MNSHKKKEDQYAELIVTRKLCRACEGLAPKMTNPSICAGGIYDNAGNIGPWTGWYGDLDADLMVIGQDWGGEEYYVDHHGQEEDSNETNKNLRGLLATIGIHIDLPQQPRRKASLYLTNSVLCLKPGRLTGKVATTAFGNCAERFLCRQIQLVNPRAIVTLGYKAYSAVLGAYGRGPQRTMKAAVAQSELEVIGNGSIVVPVFHCGSYGNVNRSPDQQRVDWQRVKKALEREFVSA